MTEPLAVATSAGSSPRWFRLAIFAVVSHTAVAAAAILYGDSLWWIAAVVTTACAALVAMYLFYREEWKP